MSSKQMECNSRRYINHKKYSIFYKRESSGFQQSNMTVLYILLAKKWNLIKFKWRGELKTVPNIRFVHSRKQSIISSNRNMLNYRPDLEVYSLQNRKNHLSTQTYFKLNSDQKLAKLASLRPSTARKRVSRQTILIIGWRTSSNSRLHTVHHLLAQPLPYRHLLHSGHPFPSSIIPQFPLKASHLQNLPQIPNNLKRGHTNQLLILADKHNPNSPQLILTVMTLPLSFQSLPCNTNSIFLLFVLNKYSPFISCFISSPNKIFCLKLGKESKRRNKGRK